MPRGFPVRPFLVMPASVLLMFLAMPVSGDVMSGSTNPEGSCEETSDVMDLYRHLRRHVINNAADVFNGTTDQIYSFQRDVSVTEFHQDRCNGNSGMICNCPHKHAVNFDPHRVPKVLVQASCCHRNAHRESGWHMECQDVTHHIPVLRMIGCAGGTYRYERVWESIPVGCSCFSRQVMWTS